MIVQLHKSSLVLRELRARWHLVDLPLKRGDLAVLSSLQVNSPYELELDCEESLISDRDTERGGRNKRERVKVDATRDARGAPFHDQFPFASPRNFARARVAYFVCSTIPTKIGTTCCLNLNSSTKQLVEITQYHEKCRILKHYQQKSDFL